MRRVAVVRTSALSGHGLVGHVPVAIGVPAVVVTVAVGAALLVDDLVADARARRVEDEAEDDAEPERNRADDRRHVCDDIADPDGATSR